MSSSEKDREVWQNEEDETLFAENMRLQALIRKKGLW